MRLHKTQVPSRTLPYLYAEPRTSIQSRTMIAEAISSTVTVIYNRRPRIVRSTDLIAAQAIAPHVTTARHRFVAPVCGGRQSLPRISHFEGEVLRLLASGDAAVITEIDVVGQNPCGRCDEDDPNLLEFMWPMVDERPHSAAVHEADDESAYPADSPIRSYADVWHSPNCQGGRPRRRRKSAGRLG
jgi:hypothetical protein